MNPMQMGEMDPRLKKRMILFYLAGIFNAVLGGYILLHGRQFLPPSTALLLVCFFFGFAAVDFYFPRLMKKRWLQEQARVAAQRQAGEDKPADPS
ncbi:MAG: hypothetical protein OEP48_03580 [Betaproteobacteria bacterium]|nr:hypothetical protein [Betaproteobacteria bacterium]MDH3436532.1 hypothetical protein [Betaproteobacteria bacterium]